VRTWASQDSREHYFSRFGPYLRWKKPILTYQLDVGYITTKMIEPYLDIKGVPEKWSNESPLGRLGRPDELRGVAVWLASDASSFCTGSE
jgi:NAD(P)-dependent dehydrogenase (short-subunit alcohol dehydrogenase family)